MSYTYYEKNNEKDEKKKAFKYPRYYLDSKTLVNICFKFNYFESVVDFYRYFKYKVYGNDKDKNSSDIIEKKRFMVKIFNLYKKLLSSVNENLYKKKKNEKEVK